ncbi:MAG: redoxin family protein [Planctomycetota bacterium]
MRLNRLVAVTALAVCMVSSLALAQDRGRLRGERPQRGPALTAEQSQSAWTWQAKSYARKLKLDDAATEQLVTAYIENRTDAAKRIEAQREARRNNAQGEGRGEGRRGRMRGLDPELQRELQADLKADIAAFVPADAMDDTIIALGTYNAQYDMMTHNLIEMNIGDEKTYAALVPMRAYIVEMSALRTSGNRDEMRARFQSAREALSDDLSMVLSEEEMETLMASMRGNRGGEGRGQRPDRQRGRDGDRPNRGGPIVNADGIGEDAPAFTIADSTGAEHSLSDFKGKVVVMQWINPDCPVCKRVTNSGKVAAMQKTLSEKTDDIVFLAVNSTHYMEAATGASYLKEHKLDMPLLIDRDGAMGKMYAAKTTPHMYVIDAEGVLRYSGALDDDSYGRKGAEATNYVVNAVSQILAGETVTPDATKPYGCSVKYGD